MNKPPPAVSRRQYLAGTCAVVLGESVWGAGSFAAVPERQQASAGARPDGPKVQLSQFLTHSGGDDTDALLAALAAAVGGTLFIPAMALNLRPFSVPSNVRLELSPGTTLKALPGFRRNDRLVNIVDVSNVTIVGNGATIWMPRSEYLDGEQRHGVFIVGSSNIDISDLVSRDSGGDGFYVGRSGKRGTHCRRVRLRNCRAINNRRQGLSIVSAEDLEVLGGSYESTSGTSPQFGIDIEPNDGADVMERIRLHGVQTRGNQGGGLLIALQAFALSEGNTVDIEVSDFVSDQDGFQQGYGRAGIRLAGSGGGAWRNALLGDIRIRNARIRNAGYSGIRLDRWDALRAPLVRIEDADILNPGSSPACAADERCGLTVWASDIGGADFGHLQATRVRVSDNRVPQRTFSPIRIHSNSGQSGVGQAANIRLSDCMGVSLRPASGLGHVLASVDMNNSAIEYTTEQLSRDVPPNDVVAVRSLAGYTISQLSGSVISLPAQRTNQGLSWHFRAADDSDGIRLLADPADRFDSPGADARLLRLSSADGTTDIQLSRQPGLILVRRH